MASKSPVNKNKKKTLVGGAKAGKTNVASQGSLTKKLKFNWKLVGLIALVLIFALGFLYVRLSHAAGSGAISVDDMTKTNGASQGTKTNGSKVIYGPGFAYTNLYPRVGLGSSGGLLAYPDVDTTYEVALFDSDNDGYLARGGSSLRATCITHGQLVEEVSTPMIKAPFTLRLRVTAAKAKEWCGDNGSIRLKVGIGAGDYITGIKVTAATPASTPVPNPAAKPAATPTPLNCNNMTNGKGNQNGCVTFIQQRLKDLGYDPGSVDGIYGDKTVSAVKVFQSKSGLPQDGMVGPQTWAAMSSPSAARKS